MSFLCGSHSQIILNLREQVQTKIPAMVGSRRKLEATQWQKRFAKVAAEAHKGKVIATEEFDRNTGVSFLEYN